MQVRTMVNRVRSKVTGTLVMTLIAVAASLPVAADKTSLPSPQLEYMLARFNAAAPPAYRAYRHLEAGNRGSSKHATMEVWTEHRPGAGFRFEVVREQGSEYVRNKVLRGVLKAEQELIENGKPLRAPLVPKNYQFEDGGATAEGLRRLLLHPARKSDGVVRGTAFVAPDAGTIVRMEGRLTKSPSFWVRDVDVVWKFTRIGDAIVPTELFSSARVLFYGRSTFRMTYDYETVDGRPFSRAVRAASPDRN
jgi:hypothetical protein